MSQVEFPVYIMTRYTPDILDSKYARWLLVIKRRLGLNYTSSIPIRKSFSNIFAKKLFNQRRTLLL